MTSFRTSCLTLSLLLWASCVFAVGRVEHTPLPGNIEYNQVENPRLCYSAYGLDIYTDSYTGCPHITDLREEVEYFEVLTGVSVGILKGQRVLFTAQRPTHPSVGASNGLATCEQGAHVWLKGWAKTRDGWGVDFRHELGHLASCKLHKTVDPKHKQRYLYRTAAVW